MKRDHLIKRVLAFSLALSLGLTLPAAAAAIPPACDETYYATLDSYGGLLDSSVVKSVRTRGVDALTDYGSYQEVVNLTDSREAQVDGGKVTFDLTGDVPDKFYFECKTTQPYEDFPWKLSMSYTLNGVPTPAEQLAGRSGMVSIELDAVPNQAANEYARNNLVLTAASLFNADDILSLEAPGAQVQLIGNLYAVLYAVLPGEEQHFTIRVGTDSFSYNGMIFLAVPATLDQLSQVADLKEAKEKAEDSYHAMNDSLHIILDTLDSMTGSLNAAANGLDQLNNARGVLSNGKGAVYGSIDTALDAAGAMSGALAPTTEHLTKAQEALTKTNTLLNEVSENLTSMKPEVENTRKILKDLKTDLTAARDLLDELDDHTDSLHLNTVQLQGHLRNMQSSLTALQNTLKHLPTFSGVDIPVGGRPSGEVLELLEKAKALHTAYEAKIADGTLPAGTPFETFITGYLLQATPGLAPEEAAAQAAQLAALYDQREQLESAGSVIGGVNDKLDQVNKLIAALAVPTANLLGDLSALTGNLESFAELMEDVVEEVDDHGGAADALLHDGQNAADLALRLSDNVDEALDQVQELTDILNEYEPDTQQALTDAGALVDATIITIDAMSDAVRTSKELLQRSGLDNATRQTLTSLAETLRRSTVGLGQSSTVRDALDTIDALVTDEWDSHAGGDNNLLLMDAAAKPVSITDSRNENVGSIQYIMRSQEIKVEEKEEEEPITVKEQDNGTFWSRVKAMFVDIWAAFISIFRFGK